ncbi:MAG: DUF5011 domain-containing protein [Nitrosopumilus sp. D6]|nr:MAG: DUF5011 domain-containing protein [Nitrosopumilus sp. D6]
MKCALDGRHIVLCRPHTGVCALVLVAAVVALSGMEGAEALSSLDRGYPLYMKLVTPADVQCSEESVGTISYSSAGVSTTHTLDTSSDVAKITYIEIKAKSTDMSIAVYNFAVSGLEISTTVPISALYSITDRPDSDVYTARPVIVTIDTTEDGTLKFVDNAIIGSQSYNSFESFLGKVVRHTSQRGTSIYVTSDKDDNGDVIGNVITYPSNPNITTCFTGFAEIKNDKSPPRLVVRGANPHHTQPNSVRSPDITSYADIDPGVRCMDDPGNYDLSGKIVTNGTGFALESTGKFTILYTCTDGSENFDTITRTLIVDGAVPMILQTGSKDIPAGSELTDIVTCTDDRTADSDLSERASLFKDGIEMSHTREPGDYSATFYCTDLAGNIGSLQDVSVTVLPWPAEVLPTLSDPTERVIYLKPAIPPPSELGFTCTSSGGAPLDAISPNVTTSAGFARNTHVGYTCLDDTKRSNEQVILYVIDGTNPVLTYTGDATIYLKPAQQHSPVVSCNDDGDISESITSDSEHSTNGANPVITAPNSDGNYPIKYSCSDRAKNEAQSEPIITVIVDGTLPVIIPYSGPLIIHSEDTFETSSSCTDTNPDGGLLITILRDGTRVSAVDPLIPGDYVISYTCTDLAKNEAMVPDVRIVVAAEENRPTITITGNDPHRHPNSTDYVDAGATCTNLDGTTQDIQGDIDAVNINEIDRYPVPYNCIDENTGYRAVTTSRTVTTHADARAPHVELYEPLLEFLVGDTYRDPGALCNDDVDHPRNVAGTPDTVDTDSVGQTTVTYMCTDVSGKTRTAERQVYVYGLLDTGAPLFINLAASVTEPCPESSEGTATYFGDELVTSHTMDSSILEQIAYIEINAKSTDRSIAVYNFTVSGSVISTTVPVSALDAITVTARSEVYTVRLVSSTILTAQDETVRFVNNAGITAGEYELFSSFNGIKTLLATRDGDAVISRDEHGDTIKEDIARHATTPNPSSCSTGSIQSKSDLTDPVLEIIGDNPHHVQSNSMRSPDVTSYADIDPGVRCMDDPGNRDLSGKVVTNGTGFALEKTGKFTILYTCTDGSENFDTITRTLIVDGQKPTITRIVPNPIERGFPLYDIVKCIDDYTSDLDLKRAARMLDIRGIESYLHTNVEQGEYRAGFICTDLAGNIGNLPRQMVQIIPLPKPVITEPPNPVVYLMPNTPPPPHDIRCSHIDGTPINEITPNVTTTTGFARDTYVGYTCERRGTISDEQVILYKIDGASPILAPNTDDSIYLKPGAMHELTLSCTDIIDTLPEITSNSSLSTNGTNPVITAPGTEGIYHIKYSCADDAGNDAVQEPVITVIVDGAPILVIPEPSVVHIQGTDFEIPATCNDNGETRITIDPVITAATPQGPYHVTVTCTGGVFTDTGPLTVTVVHSDAPVIKLNGPGSIFAEQHLFVDPGARCIDAKDGTKPILEEDMIFLPPISPEYTGTYLVIYKCTDSDGYNALDVSRTVTIGRVGDTIQPVLALNGYSKIRHILYTPYEDAGATCVDANYGELTPTTVFDNVDPSTPGTYYVRYSCTDYKTLPVTAEREVEVGASFTRDMEPPEIKLPQNILDALGSAATSGDMGRIGAPAANSTEPVLGNITIIQDLEIPQRKAEPTLEPAHQGVLHHPKDKDFEAPPAACTDSINGVISANSSHTIDVSTAGNTGNVVYSCKDASGNKALPVTLHVEIVEDNTPPEAVLIGKDPTMVQLGQEYREEGARCIDDLTRAGEQLLPVVSGDHIYDDQIKTYEMTYTCMDSAGNAADVGRSVIIVGGSRGSDEDWLLNPTFGRSWENNEQTVRGGFGFNGRVIDVTNNFHTPFAKDTADIGDINTVTAKAYTEMDLQRIILHLGVPDVSRVTDSEADIIIDVRRDYSLEHEYEIISVTRDQKESLIDEESTAVALSKKRCSPNSEVMCTEFVIKFKVMAPLSSDVVALSAMDTDRRVTVSYINDGVDFVGESLLPAATHTFQVKRGNQHPVETTMLTQQDRRYNVWTDQYGFVWLKNEYNSWEQLTYAKYERLADPNVNVMTRHHSGFADLIEQERARAELVFNSSSIKSHAEESFSHDAPVRIDKLKDPVVLEKLRIAELAALEYLADR